MFLHYRRKNEHESLSPTFLQNSAPNLVRLGAHGAESLRPVVRKPASARTAACTILDLPAAEPATVVDDDDDDDDGGPSTTSLQPLEGQRCSLSDNFKVSHLTRVVQAHRRTATPTLTFLRVEFTREASSCSIGACTSESLQRACLLCRKDGIPCSDME